MELKEVINDQQIEEFVRGTKDWLSLVYSTNEFSVKPHYSRWLKNFSEVEISAGSKIYFYTRFGIATLLQIGYNIARHLPIVPTPLRGFKYEFLADMEFDKLTKIKSKLGPEEIAFLKSLLDTRIINQKGYIEYLGWHNEDATSSMKKLEELESQFRVIIEQKV